MTPEIVMNEGLEECLYCHGNTNLARPCPVCGDVRSAEVEAQRPGPGALRKLDFRSRVLYEPLVPGV
jgi:hypothetical protein